MKNLLFLLFSYFVSFISFGQNITGFVYDAKTKNPIESATAYFDGTTMGDATDENGYFEIPNAFSVESVMIISILGYETQYIPFENIQKEMKIYLNESSFDLEEVSLDADNMSREEKMKYFKKEFLGKNFESSSLQILNEKKIILRYFSEDNTISASCPEALVIKNDILGYNISYNLISFDIQLENGYKGKKYIKSVLFTGTSYFSNIENLKKKHLKKRKKAYLGSRLHFLRSLVRGDFVEHKFNFIHNGFTFKNPENFIQKKQQTEEATIFELQEKRIAILYNNDKQSVLEIREKDKTFSVDSFGNISPPNKVLFGGEMSFKRIGEMLPLDYQLEN
ncbi:carboxypeptidase-like regulatory domain-containing protein [Aureivirga sp. CE67]|uniref:carboxypeptidase-like regulatory domain-containing protein n=1 Tax=Aureivirga sp. CE67 TaxID=1788983 RepID=UPI0018C96081|nr:carboxypeptidase-like regulatory domain-containing protein [Aureivirga sp. CE67]